MDAILAITSSSNQMVHRRLFAVEGQDVKQHAINNGWMQLMDVTKIARRPAIDERGSQQSAGDVCNSEVAEVVNLRLIR